ncbi:GNAT family N-acetyltransferase [Aquicoccus porphyridii]|uniref:GNAT family N-acetyltransferase n=1 Tax=Aquicoccus porphyridii TaxID=1852029 RepID=A0A5A9ZTX6_9RHOB|nr:GNAT family N-acetyltransferase [Aquicoccus porphyridii]KAA0920609.1 GNAT family N-acetyltransferase [Aquicoccus porphyridii]RAI56832.1 GNAT family N-acetyltransferase [Rhodobacteraceae bacterium AsT-22]
MTPISVRLAEGEDAATVAVLVHALLDELSGGKAPTVEEITERAKAVLSETGVVAVIACADDAPIGVMTLNECSAIYAGGKFGEISELYVRPEARSKGIAQQLLDRAQQEARARGWKRIEVGAPGQPEWHRTLNFYLRNGFEEVGPRLRRLV